MSGSKLRRGAVLLGLAAALMVGCLAHAGLAWEFRSLDDRPELVEAFGQREGSRGWGPWRRDVVHLPTLARSVQVPAASRGADRENVTVLVEPDDGSRVGRYVDVPFSDAWVPFAWSSGLMAFGAMGLVLLGLRPFGEAVFDQRDPAARPVTWTPGGGTHGSGTGQVPPYVPYDPDWDPRTRRQR